MTVGILAPAVQMAGLRLWIFKNRTKDILKL